MRSFVIFAPHPQNMNITFKYPHHVFNHNHICTVIATIKYSYYPLSTYYVMGLLDILLISIRAYFKPLWKNDLDQFLAL